MQTREDKMEVDLGKINGEMEALRGDFAVLKGEIVEAKQFHCEIRNEVGEIVILTKETETKFETAIKAKLVESVE